LVVSQNISGHTGLTPTYRPTNLKKQTQKLHFRSHAKKTRTKKPIRQNQKKPICQSFLGLPDAPKSSTYFCAMAVWPSMDRLCLEEIGREIDSSQGIGEGTKELNLLKPSFIGTRVTG
jgi:hypothetical protein